MIIASILLYMKPRNLQIRTSIAALLSFVCLLLPLHASAAVKLSLSGMGDPSTYGFGAKGLFLGGHFSSNTLNHQYTNWSWSDVEMTIEENGNASISGNMSRDYNNETWGVNIALSDIEFRRPNGGYKAGGNFGGSVGQQTFLDLASGINPFTGADKSHREGWGFEWKNLSLTLDKMGNHSSVPETGWEGFAMPDMGHPLVAELHYDGSNGLTFEAWYKNPNTDSWYDVGDTKALATVKSSQVPEPTGMVLLSLGLLGLGAKKKRSGS